MLIKVMSSGGFSVGASEQRLLTAGVAPRGVTFKRSVPLVHINCFNTGWV